MGEPALRPEIAELLPPPLPPRQPVPWRRLGAVLLPVASLAAGTGLQRFFESGAGGDPVLRWLCWSSGAGLVLAGLALAFARRSRLSGLWLVWGAASPWLLAGAVLLGAQAVRPLREAAADRGEARCHAEGRAVCTLNEFVARCQKAGAPGPDALARATNLLGPPLQKLCDASGCSLRFSYAGPWRPDNWVAPGSLLCAVRTDAQDRSLRSTTLPGNEVP